MRRELEKLRKENAALAERVREGRSAIANTEQRITAAVDGWKVRAEENTCNLKLSGKNNYIILLSHYII